jgi:two-component system CheB/CheR fusion protein
VIRFATGSKSTDSRNPPDARVWHIAAAVLVALIFVIDTQTPANIAVPVLYVVPTVLFVSGSGFAEPLIVAAAATVLTAVGHYLAPQVAEPETGTVNRLIATVVIWATAGFVVAYKRIVERWMQQVSTANEALHSSLRRLKDVEYALDSSAIVAATDQTGRITFANDKFCEISKYSREELLGQDHRIINSGHHPKEYIRELWRTIANGQVWRGELRNRAKDGTYYWVDTTIVPFLNEHGKPWQYLSIRNDISQRKVAEQKLLDEAALTQLGQLSAVVAHEVRNPLAAVKGSLQVLAKRFPPDVPGREIIPPLIARIDTLNETVKDILTYSRPNPPKLQRLNLQVLVRDIVSTAQAVIPAVPIHMSAEPVTVMADPEMLRAALLNLLLNATQAMAGSPAGSSADTPESEAPGAARSHAPKLDGGVEVQTTLRDDRVSVFVLDRGPGLPQAVRDRLFQPFVTTRRGGTGLGLAIAHRLTVLQGGTLTMQDRPDGGTVATLTLPLSEVRAS